MSHHEWLRTLKSSYLGCSVHQGPETVESVMGTWKHCKSIVYIGYVSPWWTKPPWGLESKMLSPSWWHIVDKNTIFTVFLKSHYRLNDLMGLYSMKNYFTFYILSSFRPNLDPFIREPLSGAPLQTSRTFNHILFLLFIIIFDMFLSQILVN